MTLGKINLAVFAAIRCHQDHCAEFFWKVEAEYLECTNKLIKNKYQNTEFLLAERTTDKHNCFRTGI